MPRNAHAASQERAKFDACGSVVAVHFVQRDCAGRVLDGAMPLVPHESGSVPVRLGGTADPRILGR
jgi:hypothetical protein